MLIAKDGMTLNVTRGAYLSLFASKGWKPLKNTASRKRPARGANFMTPQPKKSSDSTEDTKPKNEEVPFGNMMGDSSYDEDCGEGDYEVVLEDMTVKELVEYAEEKDIDLDGATKKAEIIKAIEAAEEE